MALLAELRSNAGLLALTGAGTGLGLAVGAAGGRTNWPVYLVVIVVGTVAVIALHVRYRLSMATRVGLVVFALSHVAGGMLTTGDDVLYRWWLLEPVLRYDNLQHAWGFGFVGLMVWEILSSKLDPASRKPVVAWWIVALGAGTLGAVNEIVEWILTLTIPGTDVGGYDNTVRDLVSDLAGGVIVGWWIAHRVDAATEASTPSE